ncbi:hypothetical protein PC111_g14292 [Phytophthora cactorum]|nr:hypothetical protein PC111_g14292 [Phytophthora cactorum]
MKGGASSLSINAFAVNPTIKGLSSDPLAATGFPALLICQPKVNGSVIVSAPL